MNLDKSFAPALESSDWPRPAGREMELLERVLRSDKWGLDGPFQEQFETQFAAVQTATYGLSVANGTVALQLALEALDIGVGDEVIIPSLTWQATAGSVIDVNATPVLVDVEADTYCIDASLVEAAVTPRTKAVIVVHLYSSVANLSRVLEIAHQNDLYVIEDCAHAHGARWSGAGLGSVGDIGCFSFQSAKILTAGEGGFVTTNDEILYEKLYSLRNCGRRRDGADPQSWRPVQSGNYRMSEWQAAVLCAQLERLEEQLQRRAENFARLDSALAKIPGIYPMVTGKDIQVRPMYRYVFRYTESEFGTLSAEKFRTLVSDGSGISVRAPYAPLHMSPHYQPLTKQRHRLSGQYSLSVDPSRYQFPVAERAHIDEGMIVSHEALLRRPEETDVLPRFIFSLLGAIQ